MFRFVAPLSFRRFSALFLFVTLMVSSAQAETEGSTWARYRGAEGDGVGATKGAFASLEQLGLEVVWKKPLGSGYSGIVLDDGKAVTLFAEGESDVMAAFDVETGKRLWTYSFAETYKGHDGSHDGPISTPVISEGRVFALGPLGQLFAVRLDNGEEIWTTHLVTDHGVTSPGYGFATSPVVEQGVLVVAIGGEGQAVVGFDPATGNRLWAAGSDSVAYQSPITWNWQGKRQLVTAGNEKLIGVDPKSGEIAWEYAHGGGGARGVASLMPVPAGDGSLFLAFKDETSTVISLRDQGGDLAAETVWEDRSIRNSYNVPVHHEGYLYAYSSRFLTCVDAKTGESKWRSRQPGDGFLIVVDGHLVIGTKTGGLFVVEASPEGFREKAGLELFSDYAWTAPSFADGSIYVRSLGEIARVDLRAKAADGLGSQRLADGSAFGRFLAQVEAAPEGERKQLVDRFLESQETFPVLEGGAKVHFVYRGEAQDVAVAGDMFGARREEPMTQVPGTDLFHYSLDLEPAARLNYLFITDFEQILDPLNSRQTVTTLLGKDMEMSFTGQQMEMSWLATPGWQEPKHLGEAAQTARGTLESHRLETEEVPTGVGLEVYLPKGYDAEKEGGYDVAYYHGGSALDLGKVPNSLDQLIGTTVKPVIAVFVDLQAQGAVYGKVFVGQVVPLIDERYNTRAEPAGRVNVGSAFGGFTALLVTLGNPEMFGNVATQSLFYFTSMEGMLNPMLASAAAAPPKVYMDWGKYDFRNPHESWDMSAANRILWERMQEMGFELTGGEAADGTGWSSWKNRTNKIFETFFPLDS